MLENLLVFRCSMESLGICCFPRMDPTSVRASVLIGRYWAGYKELLEHFKTTTAQVDVVLLGIVGVSEQLGATHQSSLNVYKCLD